MPKIPFCPTLFLTSILTLASTTAFSNQTETVSAAQDKVTRPHSENVLTTMRRASDFMLNNVRQAGGFVWIQELDKSRRWGELEASDTMLWMQSPGTPAIAQTLLNSFSVTGDRYYLEAAQSLAAAIIRGQQPSGGWHYFIDFASPASTDKWYATIGSKAWRLEEFHHNHNNATFDDGATIDAAMLLLRLHLIEPNPQTEQALNRVIHFVTESQFDNGGWPQRYPKRAPYSFKGLPDYSHYLTLNDDVAIENIKFLLGCYLLLDRPDLEQPIRRAINVFLRLQVSDQQPGWALQYDENLNPGSARSYEPRSLSTTTTVRVINWLMDFYNLSGEKKFLAPIPDSIDWLESLKLPEALITDHRSFPKTVAIDTGEPQFLHRRGSNVDNGEYFHDQNPTATLVHYGSVTELDLNQLRRRFAEVRDQKPTNLLEDLYQTKRQAIKTALIKHHGGLSQSLGWDEERISMDGCYRFASKPATAAAAVADLREDGSWPLLSGFYTNPAGQPGEKLSDLPSPLYYSSTNVGDNSDTSTHCNGPQRLVISTSHFIHNMQLLMDSLAVDPRVLN